MRRGPGRSAFNVKLIYRMPGPYSALDVGVAAQGFLESGATHEKERCSPRIEDVGAQVLRR